MVIAVPIFPVDGYKVCKFVTWFVVIAVISHSFAESSDLFWHFAGHSTWLISQHIWGCHSQKCASVKIVDVTSVITFQQDWALERKEAARSKSLNKEWTSKSAINCTTAVLMDS